MLEVENVVKSYNSKLNLFKKNKLNFKAIDNVSFKLEEGETVGLVGESGCGKSTLGKLILGLENVTEGSIKYKGNNIDLFKGKKLKNFRKECQIIFQDTYCSLNPNIKIIDSLMEPLDNFFAELSKNEKITKIENIVVFAKLDKDILKKYPSSISGGERQRVNICRALLLEPKLLICDEIISSLDVCTQVAIINMIKELKEKSNTTILFISHDISVVDHLCDRIIVMKSGKIVETIENKKLGLYSCKEDYTKKLLSSVPINHPSQRVNTIY
ncbi:ABC transporter ATP-binding protein [Clostridium tepidum]|jgi:ABC-type oligopeptide transport system ATPase subunit|uniref:Peptide ABC transporter ATP-binding protein n=1 Tax=Clostridium tepidum TaxID=1962263 RepID=A0A1S9I4D1_9CLOT|nr:dipeptide/oligopeptide/nickel ABC transporter ATP-binding protein [Clostridium tepidum]MCR1933299.1 dipeptide/oligopeptide/nickel ABC transporter ATP-binding protein [Clostridium tepidum]MDU6877460.1 dipeptide/oligopeptide/nickel ABC transporter ATP-binding protein [Clostridium botulinum]OOO62650.1 peptide ABC transporter ATP-binding protein [Clostridium tepidum]OOO65088.1 peptide ABC transporter ATP-binding protein [Clostridium tepidum]